jgi:hypothetical protein
MSEPAPTDGAQEFSYLSIEPTALLCFDNGTTLPACRKVLMLASPVLRDMLSAVALAAGADGAVRIPLAADSGEQWLSLLPHLHLDPKAVSWQDVDGLAYLCHKYDVRLPALDEFLAAAPVVGAGVGNGIDVSSVGTAANVRPSSVWRWLELAGRCGLPKTLQRCCDLIFQYKLTVPDGFDLGAAAQPFGAALAKAHSMRRDVKCRHCGNQTPA